MTRPTTVSETSRRKKNFGSRLQLQETCQDCEEVVRDSDMASSLR